MSVAAHPPWVPSTGDAMVFRDGGDSERRSSGVLLKEFPGICVTAALPSSSRSGAIRSKPPTSGRVRGWLGEPGKDCDVILGVEKMLTVEEVVGSVRKLHLMTTTARRLGLLPTLHKLGTDRFIYGRLVRPADRRADCGRRRLRLRMSSRRRSGWILIMCSHGESSAETRPSTIGLKSAKPRLPLISKSWTAGVKNGAVVADGDYIEGGNTPFLTALRLDAWSYHDRILQ